jgi:hypothetical protein
MNAQAWLAATYNIRLPQAAGSDESCRSDRQHIKAKTEAALEQSGKRASLNLSRVRFNQMTNQ